MMPVLLEFRVFGWDLALPTYGLVLAIAFLLALWAALRQARRLGVAAADVTDLWIVALLSGVIGAKILLYLLDYDYYIANPRAILTTLRSAGVWYGGLILAIAACLVVVKRRGMDGWVMGDVLAPAIALGQAVGRWGCFFAGCCYGEPCSLPWAVTFTDPRALEITGVPLNVPLHPVQIYMSLADLALFLVLLAIAARRTFRGQVLLSYLILYAILRGMLEMFRGDPRGAIAGLSTSQVVSIVVGLAALSLYLVRRRAGASPPEPPRARATRGRRGRAAAR